MIDVLAPTQEEILKLPLFPDFNSTMIKKNIENKSQHLLSSSIYVQYENGMYIDIHLVSVYTQTLLVGANLRSRLHLRNCLKISKFMLLTPLTLEPYPLITSINKFDPELEDKIYRKYL